MPRTKKAVASKNTCELAPKEQRNSIGAAAMSDIHAMAANSKTKQCKICNAYCAGTSIVDIGNGEVCHSTCYVCVECKSSLANQKCYKDPSDINYRYCMGCYNTGSSSLCFECGCKLVGDFVTIPDRGNYHGKCLNCGLCQRNLEDQPMAFDKIKKIFKCSPPCQLPELPSLY
ncbi:LIM and senescent cell antigen-like-containing domain protein 1 [Symsagittifera roscoffensis]|uniref:LIM and senescent cell antigen-like-containing domain protein 1 n=1 Tax=Symsagittifera roscoffensis TaxID=84072 RepID=UPI00307C85BB